jgi:hypothetical protein
MITQERIVIPEYQQECIRCGEFDYWYRMKSDLCVFCQPCTSCGDEETEKVFVSWGSIGQERGYVCLECADVLDADRRNQKEW